MATDLNQPISFEFFPPKSEEGREKLLAVSQQLGQLEPAYFSVTFGAGGSTQQGTIDTVLDIKNQGFSAAPHLSCVGSTKDNIRKILANYKKHGIDQIVALRGDIPSGTLDIGEFRYANELVEFIRKETGDHFHIEVGAYPEVHPQAANAQSDLLNFKRKVEAGADSAITQYFFNVDAYARFVEDCKKLGLTIPIVPGIMPITNYAQLARFSDMCGAEIPRWIRKRLEGFADDRESIKAFGIDVVSELCQSLLEGGAPGLHFYSMNQAEASLTICRHLGFNKG
ncbi:MAG: methylenetetrahydrofolate reductase [NAD(P)H] [Cycloclasticus sp.]|nr:methylenetetrahydrofolate reductase [NAD(P)H] [Cycloclasticus sp.]MBG95969.1 methylenetetrahydrofolate reductase [NAD(P)H] [Cycloclasticus sp.]HAI97340.1 methylenetetrahydrofolate reductase [NAD(P)H] [Methylococcaceae bacterium]|tara:strand:+ start:994 stop:1842 length:849 start_codon:yes stop_codon:yes gene_type:complete